MSAINNVTLVGRIVRNVEPKKTESGKDVCSFVIAVDGINEDSTSFVPCVAWNKTVEILEKYAPKGKQIGIVGRIQTRPYETKDGNKRTAVEVVVNQLQLLGSKSDGQHETAPTPGDEDYDARAGKNNSKDNVVDDFDPDEPIDLSQIPF